MEARRPCKTLFVIWIFAPKTTFRGATFPSLTNLNQHIQYHSVRRWIILFAIRSTHCNQYLLLLTLIYNDVITSFSTLNFELCTFTTKLFLFWAKRWKQGYERSEHLCSVQFEKMRASKFNCNIFWPRGAKCHGPRSVVVVVLLLGTLVK
mgnify:CR=1 FL=1